MINKRLINTGVEAAPAAFDPLQNFETVTYTGNGGTQKITGYIRKGAAFNGSSSKITSSPTLGNQGTFSFWVNFNNLNNQSIFATGIGTNTTVRAIIFNSNLFFQYGSSGDAILFSTSLLTTGTWHHIVGTYTTTALEIFLDGSSITSNTFSTKSFSFGNLTLGNDPQDTSLWLNGKLDQVRIFNKALSSGEVTTLYGETYASSTKSTTDIFGDGSGVALYELDEDADATDPTDTIGLAADFDNLELKYYVNNILVDTATIQSGGHWFFVGDAGSQDTSIRVNTIDSEFTYAKPSGFSEWGGSLDPSNVDTDFQGSASGFNFSENNKKWDKTGSYYHSVWSTNGNYSSGKYYLEIEYLHRDLVFGLSKSPTANTFSDGTAFYNNILAYVGFNTYAYFYQQTTTANRGQILVEPYNGTATNVNFLGMAFQPDLVWVKSRSVAFNNMLTDSINGGGNFLIANTTAALDSNSSAPTFDSNGFTLGGGNSNWNNSPYTYVAWCWKAGGVPTPNNNTDGTITSTVSANQDAGFSIVKYTGNQTASQTIGHGLSSAPELLIVKNIDASDNWAVYSSATGNANKLLLNSTAASSSSGNWNSTTPTNSVFTISANSEVNQLNNDFIAYCFHSTDYQKIGSYTGGTITSSNIVNLGFRPRWIMFKNADVTEHWAIYDSTRDTDNQLNLILYPDLSNAEGVGGNDFTITLTDDGFYWNTTAGSYNRNSQTNIYLAIA